ncbi:VC0807 family protein [Kitasatospora sp. NPDC086791]|uniref:VC0807 family protein n=1 Tax=Kitasatospora sp. NPDC086791 TaxID=3155178 RepID=UPI0034169170
MGETVNEQAEQAEQAEHTEQETGAEAGRPGAAPGADRKTGAARRALARSLVFELALPLGGFYLLHGIGLSQWAALLISGLLLVPWLVLGMVRSRRVEAMPVFTLLLIAVGALMSMVSGSPRVLLVRDSWLFGLLGLWVLGTLATRRPFILTAARPVVAAKLGEAGAQEWAGRWDHDAVFRRHLRTLTAVWGLGFAVDAGIRVALACTLPVDVVPLVNSLQWPAVLGGLFGFHFRYVNRHGLKV